jgi:hypothetical protein
MEDNCPSTSIAVYLFGICTVNSRAPGFMSLLHPSTKVLHFHTSYRTQAKDKNMMLSIRESNPGLPRLTRYYS